jgi:cytochrome b561
MLKSVEGRAESAQRARYTNVAILLHWLIAAGIVLQILLGWRMGDVEGLGRSTLLQLHKSLGITVLLLTAARLAWRLKNLPPVDTSIGTPIEKKLAHWVHIGFYILLFALPLTGWALSSLSQAGGLKLYWTVPWPNFPLLGFLPGGAQDVLADLSDTAHSALVWVMLALLGLHVLGALKHHLIDRDRTLDRMAPGAEPGKLAEPRLIAIPALLAVFVGAVYFSKLPQETPRPKPASLAVADLYLDIVQPALNRRCQSCHADDNARGGLSLTSYAAVMRGGRQGAAVTPGDLQKSELYRRISLPRGHKDYMPKGERAPLNADQTEAIAIWIRARAPASGKIGTMKFTDTQKDTLQKALGSTGAAGEGDTAGVVKAGTQDVLPVAPAADPAVIATLESTGFIARQVDKSSNLLDVNYTAKRPLTAADFANLAKIGPQIRTLSIRAGQVTDDQMRIIAGFPNVVRLRLMGNPVTDAGAASLGGMKALRQLTLVESKLSDAGLMAVAAAPNLQRVYVWNTGVTKAGADSAQAAHPNLKVDLGRSQADIDPNEPKYTAVN